MHLLDIYLLETHETLQLASLYLGGGHISRPIKDWKGSIFYNAKEASIILSMYPDCLALENSWT